MYKGGGYMDKKLKDPELNEVSGGADKGEMSLDDTIDMIEMSENKGSDEVHHFSKFKRGVLKAHFGMYKFGSGVKNKFKFYYRKLTGDKHKK